MNQPYGKGLLLLNLISVVLMSLVIAAAQDETTLKDSTPKRRLRNHAIARGFIGGESHDSYVIRVRRGQTMTVQLS